LGNKGRWEYLQAIYKRYRKVGRRRTKPGYLLKHHIPVKTVRWDVATPGFTEVDRVSHSGNSASGVRTYSERHGHSQYLDGIAGVAGTRGRGRATGLK
jgi:hypothetical protein